MKLIELTDKIEVWTNWRDRYKKWVPLFIDEAQHKINWSEWKPEVFHEFFIKSNNQCVSSLKQGYFTNEEKERIKDNWSSIAPLFRTIANSQDYPLWDTYREIQNTIRDFTGSNRKAATFRLVASLQPRLLCTIVNEYNLREVIGFLRENIDGFSEETTFDWFKDSYNVCQFYITNLPKMEPMDIITYPWQTKVFFEEGDFLNGNDMSMKSDIMEEAVQLLNYKKQIILQGPPGTGKTRLAKKIARELLIEDLKNSFTEVDLLAIVKEKTTINTFTNYNSFEIVKIDSNSFKIYPKGAKLEYKVFFSDVLDCIKDFDANDLVKKYDKKGVGSYLVGIAKYVVDNLETVRQQIIQFHPSYTYEDFVRGIRVKPNPDGDGVLYEAENKILGVFANEALQNYKLSREQVSISVSDVELFDLFINDIKEKIADSDEQRFSITDAVYLFEPDENRFKYKGDNWIAHSKGLNMKFSELQKIIAANISERAQVKQLEGVEELTKQHATYFIKVVEMFYEFKKIHPLNQTNKEIKPGLKNYVLIIDEINRANLSSVLGELIYALEYRGESVDSMYAIDGNNKLILPPNLFIIGTMNTADRSVGHIDYAIRRRFAFVDVLPEKLEENDEIWFNTSAYEAVEMLFNKNNVSADFDAKDIQIGHSYFIVKKEDAKSEEKDEIFKMKMKYEVIPILNEYVKDGILTPETMGLINEISKIHA